MMIIKISRYQNDATYEITIRKFGAYFYNTIQYILDTSPILKKSTVCNESIC